MKRVIMLLLLSTMLLAQISIKTPLVEEAPLRAHLAFLADDLLEGRGTGSRGGALAVAYLEAQLMALGLKPLSGGSYRQEVLMDGIRPLKSGISFAVKTPAGKLLALDLAVNAVISTGQPVSKIHIDAPLVFVGHGIVAPEERWNDYKNFDCRGKIVIVLMNEPPPTAKEPNLFEGIAMTNYGLRTYKYNQAALKGALGVLLVHTDASATYPWRVVVNTFSGERFQAADRKGNALEGWINEAFARQIIAVAGKDLDTLQAQALKRNFRPVELNLRLEGTLSAQVRQVKEYNVAGLLPGTDPGKKADAVMYIAHWDHLGMADPENVVANGDRIYNGAMDNASGCAAVLAIAQAAVKSPARCSQIFLFDCGEEQALLGSKAWVANPPWPLEHTLANLNLDNLNPVGCTRDIAVQWIERTSLGPIAAKVAADMGLRLTAAKPDLNSLYYRSDQFSLALGNIPGVNISSGEEFSGDPALARERLKVFAKRYHQADDAYSPDMDLAGIVQQAQYTLNLAYALAETPERPKLLKKPPTAR
jgi:Zn-dependent M28 family amino/carboxypeptidase